MGDMVKPDSRRFESLGLPKVLPGPLTMRSDETAVCIITSLESWPSHIALHLVRPMVEFSFADGPPTDWVSSLFHDEMGRPAAKLMDEGGTKYELMHASSGGSDLWSSTDLVFRPSIPDDVHRLTFEWLKCSITFDIDRNTPELVKRVK